MNNTTLLCDLQIRAMPVEDCGEPMVDLLTYAPHIQFDHSRQFVRNNSKMISFLRMTPADMLIIAQTLLPPGVNLLIKECYRPHSLQIKYWEHNYHNISQKHPDWTNERCSEECSKFVAPPDIAPHSTGGAIDLTLIHEIEGPIDMGTDFNASPSDTADATFTFAENISPIARKNRQILVTAMSKAGFINYFAEWWHWSFGDKYWAFYTQQKAAIYSPVNDDLA